MSFNQPTFTGVRKIGTNNGKDQVVMSWTINPFLDNSAQNASPILPPDVPAQQVQAGAPAGYAWFGYLIDPLQNQGQYNFGDARTLLINVSRNAPVISATNIFVPGRVVIFIPDTRQVLTYGYRDSFINIPTGLTFTVPQPYEAQNDVVPIVLKASSKLQVWLDYDIDGPTGGPATIGNLTSIVNLTLCNFDVAPVSVQ